MVNITYRELRTALTAANDEQLDGHVTVRVGDEFYPVVETGVSGDDDPADGILDPGHLYLAVDQEPSR